MILFDKLINITITYYNYKMILHMFLKNDLSPRTSLLSFRIFILSAVLLRCAMFYLSLRPSAALRNMIFFFCWIISWRRRACMSMTDSLIIEVNTVSSSRQKCFESCQKLDSLDFMVITTYIVASFMLLICVMVIPIQNKFFLTSKNY